MHTIWKQFLCGIIWKLGNSIKDAKWRFPEATLSSIRLPIPLRLEDPIAKIHNSISPRLCLSENRPERQPDRKPFGLEFQMRLYPILRCTHYESDTFIQKKLSVNYRHKGERKTEIGCLAQCNEIERNPERHERTIIGAAIEGRINCGNSLFQCGRW